MDSTMQILEAPKADYKPLTIWCYCPSCWDRTEQVFSHDAGKFEVYVCQCCKQAHEIAVR